jgi:hypothetical protein
MSGRNHRPRPWDSRRETPYHKNTGRYTRRRRTGSHRKRCCRATASLRGQYRRLRGVRDFRHQNSNLGSWGWGKVVWLNSGRSKSSGSSFRQVEGQWRLSPIVPLEGWGLSELRHERRTSVDRASYLKWSPLLSAPLLHLHLQLLPPLQPPAPPALPPQSMTKLSSSSATHDLC